MREGEDEVEPQLIFNSSLDGVNGQRHTPAAFYPQGEDPLYSADRRLSGPQC
jgi:hypothetical protein